MTLTSIPLSRRWSPILPGTVTGAGKGKLTWPMESSSVGRKKSKMVKEA